MTRKQLPKIVEAWRKALAPEWRVTLMDTPLPDHDEDDFWAVCQTKDDCLSLTIHFTDDCLKRSDREIEITIVHELLHALTRPWRKLLDDIRDDMSLEKHRTLDQQREHEEEQLVDRLAFTLVAQTHGAEPFGTVQGQD